MYQDEGFTVGFAFFVYCISRFKTGDSIGGGTFPNIFLFCFVLTLPPFLPLYALIYFFFFSSGRYMPC